MAVKVDDREGGDDEITLHRRHQPTDSKVLPQLRPLGHLCRARGGHVDTVL